MSGRPQGRATCPVVHRGAASVLAGWRTRRTWSSTNDGMTMKRRNERTDAVEAGLAGVNEVTVGGRVSGSPVERELPSGDTVVQLRLVVPRSTRRPRGRGGSASVDTIDIACWTKVLQRKAVRLKPGDFVTVHGAVRRRFWRSSAGPASRYEVEAAALDRVTARRPLTST